jgi:signal transduction histidine kinase
MADLFAVIVAVLLVVAIVIAYLLILRELRRINANLEQFIKLIVDLRSDGPAS